jgi:MoxR-like ATPase
MPPSSTLLPGSSEEDGMNINRYQGHGVPPSGDHTKSFPYLADEELREVVNMAIYLGRPLLVKGPPGCGKSRLAPAIAHELGLPLHEWHVKSTSRAKDGLYTIDMVRRLQEANLHAPRAQSLIPYLRFGPLGEALRAEGESVVLLDEIDKADIDFPNDLLRELEEKRFTIEELDDADLTPEERESGFQRTYGGNARPIIVITSNDEKELPDAFLRRCVFHWIDFPGPDLLLEIVKINAPDLDLDDLLVTGAISRLESFRDIDGVRKKPATSELIDWVRILHRWGVDPAQLEEAFRLTDLPHWRVLYKHQGDVQRVRRAVAESTA